LPGKRANAATLELNLGRTRGTREMTKKRAEDPPEGTGEGKKEVGKAQVSRKSYLSHSPRIKYINK